MASASVAPPPPLGGSDEQSARGAGGVAEPATTPRPPPRSLAARCSDLLHALRARLKYGPGASDVGFLSSRLVAARRAMESEDEPAPLFKDALAAALVGPKIMRAARAAAAAGRPGVDARVGEGARGGGGGGGAGSGGGGGRRSAVSRIAARTLWFDAEVEGGVGGVATSAVRVVLEATAAERPTAGAAAVRVSIAPLTRPPATQAVCLGAGMDTRAWRGLAGTSRIAWFEVDAGRVLAAKAAACARAGAEAPAWDGSGVARLDAAAAAASGGDGGRAARPYTFPLTVARYCALEADLGGRGWGDRLVGECGFDASSPTVFIAEGLVMYLTAGGVGALLDECAAIAAPGSVLAVVAATEAAAQAARARSGGRGIMAAWTWGCPADPAPLWAAHGWRVEGGGVATRSDIARRWGLGWTEFPVSPAAPKGQGRAERESLFIVAVREG